ncbi:hypothetical protein [Bacillus sp. 1P06AnD]|uniref:hypothetical protein n=1 Tax=Bacillus sp. 1P06AnD TaxID=3132208 RepID=UPI0039A0DA7F
MNKAARKKPLSYHERKREASMYTIKNVIIGSIVVLSIAGFVSNAYFDYPKASASPEIKNASSDPFIQKQLRPDTALLSVQNTYLLNETKHYTGMKTYPISCLSGDNLHISIENKGEHTLLFTLTSPSGTEATGTVSSGKSIDQELKNPLPDSTYQLSVSDSRGSSGIVKVQAWAH